MGEVFRGMSDALMIDHLINWPGKTALAVAFAIAAVLMITGLLVAVKKWKWFGRGLGLLGFFVGIAMFVVIREQTLTEKVSQNISVTRYRYSERTRLWAVVAMTGLPPATAAVMWIGAIKTQKRLRGEVPRRLKEGSRHLA